MSRRLDTAHRLPRILLSLLGALALALAWTTTSAAPAFAAADQIESFDATYDVQTSGAVRVQERITYRFGSTGDRHGIDRYLVTREPWDTTQDAVYTITDLSVDSPDPVATQYSENTSKAKEGREEQLRLRIGDPDRVISRSTVTYVISYTLTGATRTSGTYDEFYWDTTGLDWTASIKQVNISATVPGGAKELTCTYGAAQSTSKCQNDIEAGVGKFTQTNLAAGEGVTIGVKVAPGLIANPGPHLEPDGSKLSTEQKGLIGAFGGVTVLATVLSPLLGVFWWRGHGRDQRYADLAPGTVPLAGQSSRVVVNDPDIPIPVAFSPPKIPVAEAGLLIDGQVDTRETAATVIDLAVRGALTVRSESEDDFAVTLVDPRRATAPHEMVLLTSLFGGQPPGTEVDLSKPGTLQPAHLAMRDSVISQVADRGWFRKVPSATAARSIGFGGLVIVGFVLYQISPWLLLVAVPLLPVLATIAIVRAKLRRGQRTADGRAVCDQVEGFKTYLATAEADQLRFEEGEDIFSRYLPWAIAFELADRWAKICGDLVAMGRLPDVTPTWYYGNFQMSAFNTGFLTSNLTSAAAPAPSAGSSGTGFGGGSSFSGGGFSGGGGGGGGGGSW